MTLSYIELSERHGHRNDHGFACGAEFNVKTRRRIDIPDFVRAQLSVSEIDSLWWEEAERSKEDLEQTLRRRYKWIGRLTFVGRGPGWLAIEDTGCKPRNWDAIGKIVEKRLKEFIASMESTPFWTDIVVVHDPLAKKKSASLHHATKKPPAQLQREIDEALATKPMTSKARTNPKTSAYTKLATATSIPRIEKYINDFAYSTNYRIDPETLQITNPVKAPPESWFVMPYRGGFLFGRKH